MCEGPYKVIRGWFALNAGCGSNIILLFSMCACGWLGEWCYNGHAQNFEQKKADSYEPAFLKPGYLSNFGRRDKYPYSKNKTDVSF